MPVEMTPKQIMMIAIRGERQLEQVIASSASGSIDNKTVSQAWLAIVHETVVSLIKLYRDQVQGTSDVATRIAREYARGADPKAGAPRLDSLRSICALAREARTRAQLAVTSTTK
jgi:hypothetical protein